MSPSFLRRAAAPLAFAFALVATAAWFALAAARPAVTSTATVAEEPAPARGGPIVFTRSAMGVRFQIAIVDDGTDDAASTRIADRAYAEVARLEAIFNNWSPISDISRLNATAGTGSAPIAPELARLLDGARDMNRRTGGAYDVTVGPALRLFGFDEDVPVVPSDAELAAVRARIGSDKLALTLEPPTIRRAVEGMELDVSSAAKGFAVDAVVELLRDAGVSNAFVAASASTVYAVGAGPDGKGWPFRIDDETTWRLIDESVSTSGRSARDQEIEGRVRSHIFDPRTGRASARGVDRAVFRGPRAFEADMASTALVAMGADDARRWFEEDAGLGGRRARLDTAAGTIELAPP